MKPWTHEEDEYLRNHAGKASARKIGEGIGRTDRSVYHRLSILSISGQRSGEYHQNSKRPDVLVRAIKALHNLKFTPSEIHAVIADFEISRNEVSQHCHSPRGEEGIYVK